MFIDGLESLVESYCQVVQEGYNKTVECAKSVFKTLGAAFSSTRSLRVHSAVVLVGILSLGLPVAEARPLELSLKCCGPSFFGSVLLTVCNLFHDNFNNAEAHLLHFDNANPNFYSLKCGNCKVETLDSVTWDAGIQRLSLLQRAEGTRTRLYFYNNTGIPTVDVVTNCFVNIIESPPFIFYTENNHAFIAKIFPGEYITK